MAISHKESFASAGTLSVVAAAGYGLVQHFAKHSSAKGFLAGLFTVVFFLGLLWLLGTAVAWAISQWRGRGDMSDDKGNDGGGGQSGGGQVNAEKVEHSGSGDIIGQQNNYPAPTPPPAPRARRTIGIDLQGGEMNLEDTDVKGMGTGLKQTGGNLRSKGLSIDGEPVDDEEEEGTDEKSG